jgi:hypothetical protein
MLALGVAACAASTAITAKSSYHLVFKLRQCQ